MNKYRLRILTILVLVLFLFSPIISSTSTNTALTDKYLDSIKEVKFLKHLDPEIEAAIEMIDEDYLREILTELSVKIGPRRTGTYGCEEAAKYLYKELESMDIKTRYQHWSLSTGSLRKLRLFNSVNVEATLPGNGDLSEEVLVFNAHYDTVTVSPGAIDDGSGVAAVVAAANALSHFEFNRTIKFVLFSGEEVGLLGSRAYVKELYKNDTDILAEFNADMIGYSNETPEDYSILLSTSQDVKWIADEIKNVNEIYEIGVNVSGGWNISANDSRGYSDYWDFLLHGYECVAFWESGHYQYAHTPEDTIEKVNFGYLTDVTKLIVATLAHIADIDDYYPQIIIGAPKRGRTYYEDLTLRKYKYQKTVVIDDILICTKVKQGSVPIEKVVFYYDEEKIFEDTEEPYQFRLNKFSIFKKHVVKVMLIDELGRKAYDEIIFRYINPRLNK